MKLITVAPVKMEPKTFYEVQLDTEYDIAINFSSNPQPKSLLWKYGFADESVETSSIPVPGLENTYTARELVVSIEILFLNL